MNRPPADCASEAGKSSIRPPKCRHNDDTVPPSSQLAAARRNSRDSGHTAIRGADDGLWTCRRETMAIPGGLEPPTYCLEGSCSIQLSYGTAWPPLAAGAGLRQGQAA